MRDALSCGAIAFQKRREGSKTFCLENFFVKNILIFSWSLFIGLTTATRTARVVDKRPGASDQGEAVRVGAEQTSKYLSLLSGRQAGFVVNHSSRIGGRHLLDTLQDLGVCIARIYAPEHGLRGGAEAGERVRDETDLNTGAPVISLYNRKKKPLPGDLEGIEIMVFDMQDVGARFYTYISTLYYVLEACAEQDIPVVVLDRPNPNGHYVDGPVLDMRLHSFVGIAPLPIVHGCTVGELARLFVGEYWIRQPRPLQLTVIPCEGYTHDTRYTLPTRPSPNLPDMRSVLLYPTLCLFEGTTLSVGRGTETPFQMVGHPDYADWYFTFTPRSNAGARKPPFQNQVCRGMDFRHIPMDSLYAMRRINLQWVIDFYQTSPNKAAFFRKDNFFDLLAGAKNLRKQIEAGWSEQRIRDAWQSDLDAFRSIRKRYLLYADFIEN